jgi:hypothetical protein
MELSASGVQIEDDARDRALDQGDVNGFSLANRAVLMLETARTGRDAGSL